jgi:hypothetical protein
VNASITRGGQPLPVTLRWGPALGSGITVKSRSYNPPPQPIFYKDGKVTRVAPAKIADQATQEGVFGFAGGLPTPDASLILESLGWLALANSVVCVIAIGVASLTGSRPGTITALIAWELVLSPLIVQASSLGSLRRGLLDSVLLFLKPGPATGPPVIPMTVVAAIVVASLWLLAAATAGARRMQTRDA